MIGEAGGFTHDTLAEDQDLTITIRKMGHVIAYAERAAQAFSLDYTVVDLVEQGDDFLIYEVSAFGGFRGLLEASGVDAAAAYARYIVSTLEHR